MSIEDRNKEKPKISETIVEKNIIVEARGTEGFKELFKELDDLGGLQGSDKFYNVQELKNIINQYREGKAKPIDITRSHGLRDIVKRLYVEEQTGDKKGEGGKIVQETFIDGAKDMDTLLFNLKRMGGVPGSDSSKFYSADELERIIKGLIKGSPEFTLNMVTNNYGLRTKVRELLDQAKANKAREDIDRLLGNKS